ncbi:PAS domain-containing protein [Emcibacter nanhaiensis]|uniref:PAS domain-containing protein n=1 Tax=Emcibacter nanhaiensis TaxID=1505037 RepID=A0A501PG61_9PROT|nr:PAS domain-containing protein [Emcibacter nanhaiensis]TPD59175.1 PAS domain-containing protein [Emcibacter nanhaiensis]
MTDLPKLAYTSYEGIELDDLPPVHPVKLFADYWAGLKGDQPVPWRRKFSPLDVPSLLPYLVVLELVDTERGQDLRPRLEGEYLVALAGKGNIGNFLKDVLEPGQYELCFREVHQIMETSQPIFSKIEATDFEGGEHLLLRGMFPFCLADGEIRQFFIVLADSVISARKRR